MHRLAYKSETNVYKTQMIILIGSLTKLKTQYDDKI